MSKGSSDKSPKVGAAEHFSWSVCFVAGTIVLVFAVLAAEMAVRVYLHLAPPVDHRLIDPFRAQLHIFEPSDRPMYYRVQPHAFQRFVRHDFRVHVRINGQGFREDEEYDGAPLDVAFMGDSFGFGWGVEAEERFSDVVRPAFPDRRFLNLAFPNGYAPAFYLAYLNHHPELIPEVLVIALFAWNDLASDTEDAVLTRDAAGRLVAVGSRNNAISERGFVYARGEVPLPAGSWLERAERIALWRLGRVIALRLQTARAPSPPKPGEMSALDSGEFDKVALEALGHVAELAELVRARNGRTIVFYVPFANFIGNYPNFCQYEAPVCGRMRAINPLGEALGRWLTQHDIDFIDPVADFRARERWGERLYFEYDAHWTPAGHRAAGELIAEYLAEIWRE